MPLSFVSMTKRLIDLWIVLLFSPLWVPLALFVALLVRINLGSPVLFRQTRPGLNARPFRLIKFRTMTDARDEQGDLLPDEQRLTRFARLLRATSLDELPELINVLQGEMSLVGPRPLLMQYVPLYSSRQARRHEIKPGLTGWAQINGRNAISWDEKLEMDVWYVEHRSFWLDLKILALTFLKVITGHGITAPGHATAPYFTGSPK
jgi:lipopolysaccharide/colanic/teichoic acid biosynthesis glycosyltransferase